MRLFCVLAVVGLAGCGSVSASDDDSPSVDGAPGQPDGSGADADAGPGSFSLEMVPLQVTVPVGGFNLVPLRVNRTGSFTEAVAISTEGLPAGVTAGSLTIPEGISVGELKIEGAAPLALGQTFSFTIIATGGGTTRMSMVAATATGVPGAIDPTFAPGMTIPGVFKAKTSSDGGPFNDIHVLPDDRIAGVGSGYGLATIPASALVTKDGVLDTTYNMTGLQTFNPCACSAGTEFYGVARKSDGTLLFVGQNKPQGDPSMLIYTQAVKPGGAADIFFGTHAGGRDFEKISGGSGEIARGVVVLPNDEILLAVDTSGSLAIMKLNAGGGLASGFNGSGYVSTGLAGADQASLAVDGAAVYVLGTVDTPDGRDLVVKRYLTASGAADAGFGGGSVQVALAGDQAPAGLAVTPDHKVVVAGSSGGDFFVARFLDDGAPDVGFGGTGRVNVATTDGEDTAADVVVQADRRIVVVGNAKNGSKAGPIIARYRVDGTLDPTYGDQGVAAVFLGAEGFLTSAALQSSGKLIVGGVSASFPYFMTLTRVWF